MDIVIVTSDPNNVDINEVQERIEKDGDYWVNSIHVVDRESGATVAAIGTPL